MIVAHKTGTLLTVNHYYPFGLRWNGQGSPLHKYQFGGKEYEEELNLNTYDFHARQMDPVLGRFWGVDPMSSERVSFSPFNYVQNNPMSRVDPSGMLDAQYENEDAKRQDIMDDAAYDEIGKQFYVESYVWTKGRDQHNYYTNHDKFKENSVLDDATIGISALGIRDQMSMKELRESLERNGIANNFQTGLGAFDIGTGMVQNLTNYATSGYVSKPMNDLKSKHYTAAMGKGGANMMRGLGVLGVASFIGSSGISILQMRNYYSSGGSSPSVGIKTTLDISMGGIGFFGWQGFAVSSSYFLLENGTNGFGGYGNPLTTPK